MINNAGFGLQGDLSSQLPEDWREMLDINVLALSICTQEALKDMEGKGEAHIINISSIAAHRVPPGASPFYSASKHAVRALTEGLRIELAKKGSPVRLGMISPGLVETGFHDRATKGRGDSRAFYSRFKPLTSEDIAEVVCFLLATPPHVNIHDVIIRSTEQPF